MVLLIKQALALSGTGCCSKIQRMGLEAVGLWLQNLESISNPPTLCIATQLSLGECVRSIVEIPASKQLLTALANLGSAFGWHWPNIETIGNSLVISVQLPMLPTNGIALSGLSNKVLPCQVSAPNPGQIMISKCCSIRRVCKCKKQWNNAQMQTLTINYKVLQVFRKLHCFQSNVKARGDSIQCLQILH